MVVNEKNKRPPHASGADIDRLFDGMRPLEDPRKISTKWVEDHGLAEVQASEIVDVLKWLNMFDENGKTLGFWNALRVPAFRQEVLSKLIEESYADIFSLVDVPKTSKQDLEAAFTKVYSTGDPRRPVGAFLSLCRHAGIETRRSGGEPDALSGRRSPNAAARY